MENSGQGGKKIVFKKRILASQSLPEEPVEAAPERAQEESQEQVDYSHYYYRLLRCLASIGRPVRRAIRISRRSRRPLRIRYTILPKRFGRPTSTCT